MPRSQPPVSDHDVLTFNVSTLLTEPIGSQRRYALVDAIFRLNGQPTSAIGEVLFTRTDRAILVNSVLHFTITETCGRCLTPYALPLAVELMEEFWPDYDPITRTRPEIPEGREGFPIVEGHLDLDEALRQYVEMERPMRPTCSPACPGPTTILPDDSEPPLDDRWATLRSLRERLQ